MAVYVRNAENHVVTGPLRLARQNEVIGSVAREPVRAAGKLRLDVVSRCNSFAVRADGVEPAHG